LVSHDMDSANKYADYIVNIRDGKIEQFVNQIEKTGISFKKNIELADNILSIYDKIPINENITLSIEYLDSKEKIVVNKSNFLSKIQEYLREVPLGINLYVNVEKQKSEKKEILFYKKEKSNVFNRFFQFKYAVSLLLQNKFKTIFSTLIVLLSLLLAFVGVNIMNFNVSDSLETGIEASNNYSFPLEYKVYNEVTEEYIDHYRGDVLYNIIDQESEDSVISIFEIDRVTDNDKLINTALLNVVDSDVLKDSFGYENLSNNEVIVTDAFISYYFPSKTIGDTIKIRLSSINDEIEVVIKDIINTDFYKNNIQIKMIDEKYLQKNHDELLQQYFSIYITKDIYQNIIITNSISLDSSNFLISDENYGKYTGEYNSLKYTVSNYRSIVSGYIPTKINEIAISEDFANEYFDVSYNEIIGNEYYYKDLKKSLNYKKYLSTINIFDIIDKVKIVGVVDSDSDIITSLDFMNIVTKKSLVYNCTGLSVYQPNKKVINKTLENDIVFITQSLQPIYAVESAMQSSLNALIVTLNVIFILLASMLLYFFCNLIIKNKMREIAILKSLGISMKKLFCVFLYHNCIQIFFSFLLSIILGLFFINFTNNSLAKEDVFNINYDLFLFSPISLIIVLAITIIIVLLGTLLPFLKLRKIEIASILKKF